MQTISLSHPDEDPGYTQAICTTRGGSRDRVERRKSSRTRSEITRLIKFVSGLSRKWPTLGNCTYIQKYLEVFLQVEPLGLFPKQVEIVRL